MQSYLDLPLVEQGDYCTTKEVAPAVIAIILHTPEATQAHWHNNIWGMLQSWGCCWIWESLRIVGKDDWIKEAIKNGLCIAGTDGSYMKQVHPELCANTFIMECLRGRGHTMGSFAEASCTANVYRGELLRLMKVHLILLAVQPTAPALEGKIVNYLDCPGALGQVSLLLPYRIPTRYRQPDDLKNILGSCGDFTFQQEFCHVKTHQDDSLDFHLLDWPAQLNCIVDASAKQEILNADLMALLWKQRFPKEPIRCFVGKEKMNSNTGPLLRFWAYKQITRDVFARRKIFDAEQFKLVAQRHVSAALEEVPRMIQLWVCTQSWASQPQMVCKLNGQRVSVINAPVSVW